MHPFFFFTTGCSAKECSSVLAQLHGNSALLKISEAGKWYPRHPASIRPSGDESARGEELMVLWTSEWRRTAGWFTPHGVRDVKMKLQRKQWEFFCSCLCGSFAVGMAWSSRSQVQGQW